MKVDNTNGPRPGVALATVAAAFTIAAGITIGAIASYAGTSDEPAASENDVPSRDEPPPRRADAVADSAPEPVEEPRANAAQDERAVVRVVRGERDHERRERRHHEDDDDDD